MVMMHGVSAPVHAIKYMYGIEWGHYIIQLNFDVMCLSITDIQYAFFAFAPCYLLIWVTAYEYSDFLNLQFMNVFNVKGNLKLR